MSRQRLVTSVAVIGLMGGLAAPLSAQEAQTTAPAAEMPAPLAALNLTRVQTDTKRDGMREIEGFTADGVQIEAKVDMAGNVVDVEADDGPLPTSLVEALVPQAARDSQVMAEFGRVNEISVRPQHIEVDGRHTDGTEISVRFATDGTLTGLDYDDGAIPAPVVQSLLPQSVQSAEELSQFATINEIVGRDGFFTVEGEDSSGEDMKAEFDQDGQLLRFGRDGGREGRDRDREHRRGDRGDRGDRDHRGGDHGDEAHRGGPDGGPDGGPRAAAIPADFDAAGVNQRLTQAGYTAFGFLHMDGPRILLDANNPQGETVTLELDPQGEVVRETAR